ncbi:hypothetical protein O23A_p1211 [Aeromonas salmonicida]|nr:hypothetical protein O23A_p1211 [Aeromonas salmonicida]
MPSSPGFRACFVPLGSCLLQPDAWHSSEVKITIYAIKQKEGVTI